MQTRLSVFIVALIYLSLGMVSKAMSQSTDNCNVLIKTPSIDGASVTIDGEVSGTASIPEGSYLWVLIHRSLPFKNQGVWWPQGNAEIKEGMWKSWVTYGEDRDVGHEFEIAIIVVDRTEHLKLQSYVDAGNWSKNVKMPQTKCPPVFRTVRKN